MGELAELALLNGPALIKNIDKLVSRGLVQRAVDAQDSRKVLVFISDLWPENGYVAQGARRRAPSQHRGGARATKDDAAQTAAQKLSRDERLG